MEIKYFDNSATTKIKNEVIEEMLPFLRTEYGNPSAIYKLGVSARNAVEVARKRVAALINCSPEEIYFTSCGTESDNTAIKGYAYANKQKGRHIITSKIEHPAVLNACKNLEDKGFEVTYIDVDKKGIIKFEDLKKAIRKDTILISIMTANNEIGTIQPIEEIAKIAHLNNIVFHTDSVQAIGNIKIDVRKMHIDMLSLSGHKIYAPKGIGVLYVKKGIEFERFMDGGHQEKEKRSGTENVAGIVGLGKACQLAQRNLQQHQQKLRQLRDYFLEEIQKNFSNVYINGDMENRLPGNINLSFIGFNSNEMLNKLDEYGICASGGAACSARNKKTSHVLKAIGLPKELSETAIRFTFGDFNTKEDIDYLIKVLINIIEK